MLDKLKFRKSGSFKKGKTSELPRPVPSNASPKMGHSAPAGALKFPPPGRSSSDLAASNLVTTSGSQSNLRLSGASRKVMVDEHKQLKEEDRPVDKSHSSDPDTSLAEYQDDNEVIPQPKMSIQLENVNVNNGEDDTSTVSVTTSGASRPPAQLLVSKASPSLISSQMLAANAENQEARSSHVERKMSPSPVTSRSFSRGRDAQTGMTSQSFEDFTKRQDAQTGMTSSLARENRNSARLDNGKLVSDSKEATEKRLKELKKENKRLNNLVYRLNVQLSRCQTQHQPITDADGRHVTGLPENAPTPAWLINFKYLSPLVKAYEDDIMRKDRELVKLRKTFDDYQQELQHLVNENERLRQAAKDGSHPDCIDEATWKQLQKHALLVADENLLLLQELDLSDSKFAESQRLYTQQVLSLESQLQRLDAERIVLNGRVNDLRTELHESKAKQEELKEVYKYKIDPLEHNQAVSELKGRIHASEVRNETDKVQMRDRISELEAEKLALTARFEKALADLKHMEREKQRCDSAVINLEQKVESLEVEVSDGNRYLTEIICMAENSLCEWDSLKSFAKAQHKDKKHSIEAIVESEIGKEKLIATFKLYQRKMEDKLQKLLLKREKHAGEFDSERREYERQIKHLQLLVHERDCEAKQAHSEKQDVEECLEYMWKAALSDGRDKRRSLKCTCKQSVEEHMNHADCHKDELKDTRLKFSSC